MISLMNILKQKKGVTLIELLVVVVILGIIASIAIPAVMSNQADTYINTNKQNLKIVQDAVARYVIDHGGLRYPTADNSHTGAIAFDKLTGTTNPAGNTAGSDLGPYLQERPDIYNQNGDVITPAATTQTEFWITDGKVVLPTNAAAE